MKAPISWLKEFVPISISARELAEKLTLAGSEVSHIDKIGGKWEGIVVGEIITVNKHPNADRLSLVTVSIGTGSPTVVTGAPNIKAGDKVAFAGIGAELIDGHTGVITVLKMAVLRGVESAGMVLSERELGISDAHEGILVLPADTPVGTALADVLAEEVLDLEITPNRPDCLSIIGLAREAGAVTGATVKAGFTEVAAVKVPEITYTETGAAITDALKVDIAAQDLCSRYTAGIIRGLKIGQSPDWLKKRLVLCGMRPINNLVDITNYVMLEYGQPLHAFDASKIAGAHIIVRRALEGEKITTLDSLERTLTKDTLVIADDEKAVAIAGVMGGANSEVSPQTTDIILESASFNGASIHYTAADLKLRSEASMRFERNLSPEMASYGLRRAIALILEVCGGQAAGGIIDVYPGAKARWERSVRISFQRMTRVMGFDYGTEKILKAMKLLGLEWIPEVSDESDSNASDYMRMYVPYWRSDLVIEEDIYEEVARINGYDLIPLHFMAHDIPKRVGSAMTGLRRAARLALAGFGFQELLSFSLTSDELRRRAHAGPDGAPAAVGLLNPLSSGEECLRTSLRPGLLSAIAQNRKYEDGGLRLFEIGRVYFPKPKELPTEIETLGAVITGRANPSSWQDTGRSFDFYDIKGLIESILGRLNAGFFFVPGADDGLRPGYQAEMRFKDAKLGVEQKLGVFGEIHPQVSRNFELAEPVYLFEINLPLLLRAIKPQRTYQSIPRYPSVERDLAVVVDETIGNAQVMAILEGFELVKKVLLFDVYTGKQVPPGKKSLAYRITYRSDEGTLTDGEADSVQSSILGRLSSELGATLRT